MPNLFEVSQKLETMAADFAELRHEIDQIRAKDTAPDLDTLKQLIIARSVQLAGYMKNGNAPLEVRVEHTTLNRLIDVFAPPMETHESKTLKADLAADYFKKRGVLNDGENYERKDSPKTAGNDA